MLKMSPAYFEKCRILCCHFRLRTLLLASGNLLLTSRRVSYRIIGIIEDIFLWMKLEKL